MKSKNTAWEELLPVAAAANLQVIKTIDWVQHALRWREVACNLDQNVAVQEHIGTVLPTILASTSHMSLARNVEINKLNGAIK